MRKEKQILFRKLALVSAIATALAGCGADDQAYDTLAKPDNLVSKTQIKTDQVYLYMPSMAKAPDYAVSMAPFTQGKEKLVTLKFEGDVDSNESGSLQVRMISPDIISQDEIDQNKLGRWTDVQSNQRPIMTIPGDFVDYQCSEDDYGDCTNKEEEVDNNEVSWQERRFFVPDFSEVEVHEKSWDDVFTYSSGCYTESGDSRLVRDPDSNWKGYEITQDGVINFEIEQEYSIANNFSCLIDALNRDDADISDLTFTVSHFYSLVPLDMVRSPSLSSTKKDAYEPIVYQKGDEDTFGFFANEQGRSDVSYVGGQFDQKFNYLHRFNPKLETIDYHLSNSFDLNDNTRFFKQITKDVIAHINPQLERVGVPRINLIEPSGKQPGDLRYNVINLIDEPLKNGLAGYGPSAVNPLTGEIVHAHVNQYSGVLQSISDWLWDKAVIDYNKGRVGQVAATKQEQAASADQDVAANTTNATNASNQTAEVIDGLDNAAMPIVGGEYAKQLLESEPMAYESMMQALKSFQEQKRLNTYYQPSVSQLAALQSLEKRYWSENNMYSVDNLRAGATFKSLPTKVGDRTFDYKNPDIWRDGKVGEPGYLKKWRELPTSVRDELGIFIAGAYYTKTLVHELGHNLGLRHNFKGSNDEHNYFSQDELAQHGLKTVPGYSSIMDYNPSMLNALPVYGPYDLAALRFGYSRKLETNQKVTAPDGKGKTAVKVSYLDVSDLDKKLRAETFRDSSRLSSDIYDGVVKAAEQKLGDAGSADTKLREFMFCTDGNVSLNEDCNRHDEGRNRGEIAAFKLESYDDLYYQRTIRGLKANFSEETIVKYANGRISTFMDWRNSIHNFDRWRDFVQDNFKDDLLRIYLSKVNPLCTDPKEDQTDFVLDLYCGSPRAVDSVRDKFVDILTTPDHTCELKDEATGQYSYRSLAEIIDDYNYRNNFAINYVPESCFDPAVVKSLTEGDTPRLVTGEAGKYLNSGSAPRPAPVNNYSNYIDYIGHWPDRLAAAVALVERIGERRTTDRSTMALFDLLDVEVVNGQPLVSNPKEEVLNTIIKGEKRLSVSFKDEKGVYHQPHGDFEPWSWSQKLERMPYYGSDSVRDYFGLPKYEEVSLIKAILTAMVKHSAGNMTDQRDEVFARSITMRSESGWQVDPLTYVRSNGKTYYAAADNTYAQDMIKFVRDFDALSAAEKSGADLTAVQLSMIALADYQDETKKALLAKQYAYQKQSLEYLPIYNTTATLVSDLLNH